MKFKLILHVNDRLLGSWNVVVDENDDGDSHNLSSAEDVEFLLSEIRDDIRGALKATTR